MTSVMSWCIAFVTLNTYTILTSEAAKCQLQCGEVANTWIHSEIFALTSHVAAVKRASPSAEETSIVASSALFNSPPRRHSLHPIHPSKSLDRMMFLTKSIGSSALLVLVLLHATHRLPPVSGALTFDGTYTRTSVSPSVCVATSSCAYKCSASYRVTVSGDSATIFPTSNPSRCDCETLTATIWENTAAGMGSTFSYSLKRTATGIVVVTSDISGLICMATYTGGTSSSTAESSTTSTSSPIIGDSSSVTSSTAIPRSDGITQVSGFTGVLGWAIAASSALVLYYL